MVFRAAGASDSAGGEPDLGVEHLVAMLGAQPLGDLAASASAADRSALSRMPIDARAGRHPGADALDRRQQRVERFDRERLGHDGDDEPVGRDDRVDA